MINEIIDRIRSLSLSSTQVADALGKKGGLSGFNILNFNGRLVGRTAIVYTYGRSNFHLHQSIQNVECNSIVVIIPIDCSNLAIFGELVTRFLFEKKSAIALVVLGNIRDYDEIENNNYPIWFYGTNPIGCSNKEPKISLNKQKPDEFYSLDNGVGVLDKTGFTVIENSLLTEKTITALNNIKDKEILWEKEIFTHNKTTFEVICKPNEK